MNSAVSVVSLASAKAVASPVNTGHRRTDRSSSSLRRRRRSQTKYRYRDKLPFTGKMEGQCFWWNVTPSGDYAVDYKTGQKYASAFWRVCGGRGTCGMDLGEILFAIAGRSRTGRRSDRGDGLSGIEIGFIRTVGTILDAATIIPVLVTQTKAQLDANLRSPKYKLPRDKLRVSAKFTQILLDNKQRQDRERDAASALGRRHRLIERAGGAPRCPAAASANCSAPHSASRM